MLTEDLFHNLKERLQKEILVLDGAFGTMVQRLNLDEKDFRDESFSGCKHELKGLNDVLCVTRPDIVSQIHREYLEAGADIISTNSFNCNAISLADYDLEDKVYQLAFAAAKLARDSVDLFQKGHKDSLPRYVAGSVGPTCKSASISSDLLHPEKREVEFSTLAATYELQMKGLLDGGADIILIETVFDTLNAKAALFAADKLSKERGIEIPVMLSMTIANDGGKTLSGQSLEAFLASVDHYPLLSLGLNCSFGPEKLMPHVRRLSEISPFPVSMHPNAGLPNENGDYDVDPLSFSLTIQKGLDERILNIVGGCCGTTPEHIAQLSQRVKGSLPRIIPQKTHTLTISNLDTLAIDENTGFINVGERTNVAGSAAFSRLIREKKYEEAIDVARKQIDAGAQIIDICMDAPMIDAVSSMKKFLNLIGAEPEISRVPIMIDSSDMEVIKTGLESIQGKSIVNSISLKEGEEDFLHKAAEIKRYGALPIVMLFDEEGQADTFDRKCKVAKRVYDLLTKNGFAPEEIIIDPNILTIATGIPEHDLYAKAYIDATRWIKTNLPHAKVSGGVSNLSFAFRGNNKVRKVLHSVFLYHAVKAGMDMAILNPQSFISYSEIEPDLLLLAEDLILYRRPDAAERLLEYASKHDEEKESSKDRVTVKEHLSVEELIKISLIKGDKSNINEYVGKALEKYKTPFSVIEKILMPSMSTIGQYFGEGKMFLPQVVKSARVLKDYVTALEPFLPKDDIQVNKGKVLIATVKGDIHDIGKNIVSLIAGCNGFDVIDLGVMVDASEIACKAVVLKPEAILLSGLITPSLTEMIKVCRELERRGITIPVIVGGATTSEKHTALKIAPEYSGVVVHSADAAANSRILSNLVSEKRDEYIKQIKEDQLKLRNEFFEKNLKEKIFPVDTARNRANKKIEPSPAPLEKGIFVFNDISIEEIIPLINWSFYFNAWGLKGISPEIFQSPQY